MDRRDGQPAIGETGYDRPAFVLNLRSLDAQVPLARNGFMAVALGSEETKRLLECLHERLCELHLQPGLQTLDGISTRHPQYGQDVSHKTEYNTVSLASIVASGTPRFEGGNDMRGVWLLEYLFLWMRRRLGLHSNIRYDEAPLGRMPEGDIMTVSIRPVAPHLRRLAMNSVSLDYVEKEERSQHV